MCVCVQCAQKKIVAARQVSREKNVMCGGRYSTVKSFLFLFFILPYSTVPGIRIVYTNQRLLCDGGGLLWCVLAAAWLARHHRGHHHHHAPAAQTSSVIAPPF